MAQLYLSEGFLFPNRNPVGEDGVSSQTLVLICLWSFSFFCQ